MKRVCVVFVLSLILFSFLVGAEPDAGIGAGDVEGIQEVIDILPIDPESGGIDPEQLGLQKSKAEERIEAVNEYVGPITNFLWGQELTLSWAFVFGFIFWILLIEIIVVPVSEIFDWNFWMSFVGSGIIATLAMRGFGDQFVELVNSLVRQWWMGLIVLAGAGLFGFFYLTTIKALGKKVKVAKESEQKAKTKKDRAVIHAEAEVAKEGLENFAHTTGMRRGGENKRSGRFVKKVSVEKYAEKYGNEAAKERFG